jgi:hypothetical protein
MNAHTDRAYISTVVQVIKALCDPRCTKISPYLYEAQFSVQSAHSVTDIPGLSSHCAAAKPLWSLLPLEGRSARVCRTVRGTLTKCSCFGMHGKSHLGRHCKLSSGSCSDSDGRWRAWLSRETARSAYSKQERERACQARDSPRPCRIWYFIRTRPAD